MSGLEPRIGKGWGLIWSGVALAALGVLMASNPDIASAGTLFASVGAGLIGWGAIVRLAHLIEMRLCEQQHLLAQLVGGAGVAPALPRDEALRSLLSQRFESALVSKDDVNS